MAEPDLNPPPRPRFPTVVTADRIADHLHKYADHITPTEHAAMERAAAALDQIPFRIRASGQETTE